HHRRVTACLDVRRYELRRGLPLHLEKVGRAQVPLEPRVAAIGHHRGGLYLEFHRTTLELAAREDDRAGELLEDTHVLGRHLGADEADLRKGAIDRETLAGLRRLHHFLGGLDLGLRLAFRGVLHAARADEKRKAEKKNDERRRTPHADSFSTGPRRCAASRPSAITARSFRCKPAGAPAADGLRPA